MDRSAARERGGEENSASGGAAAPLLPSREAALAALATALQSGTGPVLLTGEAGVGKSWLRSRLVRRLDPAWRPMVVDLSPALDPIGLYRLILRGMAVARLPADPASARFALDDRLLDAADEGERWLLIVEECHAASDEVLEELRVLGNRIGSSDGLGGMLLVGHMSVARRLAVRPLDALAQRLAARVHLRPLGVDELTGWLDSIGVARPDDPAFAERLHLETRGNPRLCWRKLGVSDERHRREPMVAETTERPRRRLASTPPASEPSRPPLDLTTAVPARPPLEVADGVIEVGWDARIEEPAEPPGMTEGPPQTMTAHPPTYSTHDDDSRLVAMSATGRVVPSVEVVEDRYAALQAWNEWMKNQGRSTAASSLEDAEDGAEDMIVETPDPAEDEPVSHPEVRAEGQHGFAPYSQLFSRLREAPDPSA